MGWLVSVREDWATFLRSDAPSGAAAYFTPAGYDPAVPATFPIGVQTEKLGTIEQKITDGLTKVGLSIVLVTVTARQAQNQVKILNGANVRTLYFGKTMAVARIFEQPATNRTGQCASDCAEAVAWFTSKFSPGGGYVMELQDIVLAPNAKSVAYDVVYTIEGGTTTAPSRT